MSKKIKTEPFTPVRKSKKSAKLETKKSAKENAKRLELQERITMVKKHMQALQDVRNSIYSQLCIDVGVVEDSADQEADSLFDFIFNDYGTVEKILDDRFSKRS